MSGSVARVLIFHKTLGFRHLSIPTAVESLRALGPKHSILFDDSDDASLFTDATLSKYDALVFVSPSDLRNEDGSYTEILDASQKEAFQNYLNLGGNFVGVHLASGCLRQTEFFSKEIGAYFDYHPALQTATFTVLDPTHPSTSMLPERWPVADEIYNFKSDPRTHGATILLSVDESSYIDDGVRKFEQGSPHPIAWYEERGAGALTSSTPGRSWYSSLGHTSEVWKDPLFLGHVFGGITWALDGKTTRAFNPAAKVGNLS